ncbi:MAG TPA: hypothetical protein VHT48_02725 [Methylocella sp.]|nr:hypothetical protein [Methylocella sp.]
MTGFRRATLDCWPALWLGASCLLFQGAVFGILGMGLWGGSARAQGQTLALTTTVAGLSLGNAPATVALTPLPELAPALRAAQNGAAPVILAIEGVSGQPVHPLRINVFVGKPDATPKTSTNDPHFVGYIAIDPKYGGGQRQRIEVSRDFDVSNLDLSSESRGLQVTLVPVAGIAEAPRGLSLRVRKIYLRRDR